MSDLKDVLSEGPRRRKRHEKALEALRPHLETGEQILASSPAVLDNSHLIVTDRRVIHFVKFLGTTIEDFPFASILNVEAGKIRAVSHITLTTAGETKKFSVQYEMSPLWRRPSATACGQGPRGTLLRPLLPPRTYRLR